MRKDNMELARHLQGLVRFPTVSCVNTTDLDLTAFRGMHEYIENTYPLLTKTLKREIVGPCGLLYHWKGTGKSDTLPLVLMAHQDVVPEGDHAQWKYPPFEGAIEEGCVWGRGSVDSKANMLACLESVESLLEDGFTPDCDVYLAFGYNEEVAGSSEPAAGLIAKVLEDRGIQVGMVMDECGYLEKKAGGYVANLLFCEKGYADIEISVPSRGGHSCKPPVHSGLGELAKAICILEDNPMPQKLIPAVAQQLRAMAPDCEDEEEKKVFFDPEGHVDELFRICEKDPVLNAMTRTTTAVTMCKGSDQANILPERAWAVANNRILPGETVDDLMQHYRDVLPEYVQIKLLKGSNPPAIQSLETKGCGVILKVLEEMYPGVRLIPNLLLGGTDSRYFCGICPTDSVYRMTGLVYDSRWAGNTHKVNERVALDVLGPNVDFYIRVIEEYTRK